MFVALFYAFINVCAVVGVVIVFYKLFLSKYLKSRKLQFQKEKDNYISANKIAKVKLISDNIGDIESFIIDNAKYLSEDMVNQLVSRLELLKCDQIIYNDTIKDNPTKIEIKPRHTEYVRTKRL